MLRTSGQILWLKTSDSTNMQEAAGADTGGGGGGGGRCLGCFTSGLLTIIYLKKN